MRSKTQLQANPHEFRKRRRRSSRYLSLSPQSSPGEILGMCWTAQVLRRDNGHVLDRTAGDLAFRLEVEEPAGRREQIGDRERVPFPRGYPPVLPRCPTSISPLLKGDHLRGRQRSESPSLNLSPPWTKVSYTLYRTHVLTLYLT